MGSDRMKLSAILFVASASAQYESYDNNYANTDNNYAPAQEYDPYGGEYQQYDNTVPADEERRGAQQEPSAPRPGQKSECTPKPLFRLLDNFRLRSWNWRWLRCWN